MKYLMVGLLLIAGLAGRPAPLDPEPLHTYASATFAATSPAGEATTVDLFINLDAPISRLGLRIDQTRRVCDAGACRETPTVAGFALQEIEPAQAFIDPRRNGAWLHATVLFPDDVSRTTIAVQVDVLWTATGAERCDTLVLSGYGSQDCTRLASALGTVRAGSLVLIPAQTVPDANVRTSLPAYGY